MKFLLTPRLSAKLCRLPICLLVALYAHSAHAQTTYYVDSKYGSDAYDGLSTSRAFKTIGKVNTILSTLQAGDSVLFHAAYSYTDDYIQCVSNIPVVASTTLTSNPPSCSGTATSPITFGRFSTGNDPIIDAADPLSGLIWTSLGGGVYSAPLSILPQKLYIDKYTETPQLIPVPNYVGSYSASTSYAPWDSVLSGSTYEMNGGNAPQKGTLGAYGTGAAWLPLVSTTTATPGQTIQAFVPTNTGLQNVAAIGGGSVYLSIYGGTGYPASMTFTSSGGGSVGGVSCSLSGTITNASAITYTANSGCATVPAITVNATTGSGIQFYGTVDGGSFYYATTTQNGANANYLYVHLADGSDPSTHTFYATHRPYGIELYGVNGISISHIQFAHQLKSGVLSFPEYSTNQTGQYWTGEYISVSHVTCWNTGDTVGDTLPWKVGTSRVVNLEGCVVIRASGDTDPHFVRGDSIADSKSGIIDAYYGKPDSIHSNFAMAGVDGTQTVGGVTTSYPVIQFSYGASKNAACIRYGTVELNPTLLLNQGGIVQNNECTSNPAGNIFFGSTAGGRVTSNYIHESLGEGVQGGGFSTSVSDPTSYQAQLIDHNIIVNLGLSASTTLYNGIDLNNGENTDSHYTSDLHVFNNTIFNTYAACTTFELNVVGAHFHDNACSQASNYYPSGWKSFGSNQTVNYAASVYASLTSLKDSPPMDWHNNGWQNQNLPNQTGQANWVVYSDSHIAGTCGSNLSTWLGTESMNGAPNDTTTFCTGTPGFTNSAAKDFTLTSTSPLRGTGTNGIDIGALPYGSAMFTYGPRP